MPEEKVASVKKVKREKEVQPELKSMTIVINSEGMPSITYNGFWTRRDVSLIIRFLPKTYRRYNLERRKQIVKEEQA